MSKFIKAGPITFISFICVLTIGYIAFEHSLSGMCVNTVFQELISPGKEFKAILFQRNCGATTGFSTQISLIPADGELPNDGGNIYVIDGHPDNNQLNLIWSGPSELIIRNTLGKEAYKKEKKRLGVSIRYE